MQNEHLVHIRAVESSKPIDVRGRQLPLRTSYEADPSAAWVTDSARTVCRQISADHPIHSEVVCGEGIAVEIPVSVHSAVGGESDFPCPGDLMAAALASCLDTAIRMIANIMQIKLKRLEVQAHLSADVRGTLMMGKNVPVGFQDLQIKVDISSQDPQSDEQLKALLAAAERSCVLLQTLRSPPAIKVDYQLGGC